MNKEYTYKHKKNHNLKIEAMLIIGRRSIDVSLISLVVKRDPQPTSLGYPSPEFPLDDFHLATFASLKPNCLP